MKRWISLMLSVLLLAALLLLHHAVVQDALHTLPEAALAEASPPVTLSVFTEAEFETPMTPVLTMPGYLETQAVTAYYTTADAPALFALTMCDGGFDAWEAGSIVISDRLAVALFLTDQAVGRMVRFNGQEYTVRGVYAEPNSFLARISQTTTSTVYLPLTAYPDQNAAVDEWIVGLDGALSTEHLAPEIELRLGTNLTFRSAYHFDETRSLAQQSSRMQMFLLALIFCLLSVWYTCLWEVRLMRSLKGSGCQHIFFEHRREVLFLLASLGCVIVGFFWIISSAFPLFLPHDFILRTGSIGEYIVGNFQLTNEKAQFFLCSYSRNMLNVLTVLDLCTVVLLCLLTRSTCRTMRH